MTVDVILEYSYQITHIMERAATQALPQEQIPEPPFDQIQLRTADRRGVQGKARVASKPRLRRRMLVGRVVAHDQMQV